ncbi:MAG: cyclic nucleotide-binding domain-containing protein [Cyclobacteriaceae bacterium]|nr:cyclic nucleotide-binding domain-containing protein [Cyclobacteriaceae bacterium]
MMINPFAKKYTVEESKIFQFLSKIPVFGGLSNKELAEFIPSMHERSYKQNECVFLRNDPSHAMYIVKTGEVVLSIDIEGATEELRRITGGNAIGKSCLLPNTKRQMNAIVSSEKAEFYVIPQVNFLDIFNHKPNIHVKMMSALAKEYNKYNANLFKAYRKYYGIFELKHLY